MVHKILNTEESWLFCASNSNQKPDMKIFCSCLNFLGLLNSCQIFCPDLSVETHNLSQLPSNFNIFIFLITIEPLSSFKENVKQASCESVSYSNLTFSVSTICYVLNTWKINIRKVSALVAEDFFVNFSNVSQNRVMFRNLDHYQRCTTQRKIFQTTLVITCLQFAASQYKFDSPQVKWKILSSIEDCQKAVLRVASQVKT